MKSIYKRKGDGGEGPLDSNLQAFIGEDGSLNFLTLPYTEGYPYLAEKHILSFIDALRRAYAERYDIVHKTVQRSTTKARRSAAKGRADDQCDPDGYAKS